MPMRMNTPTSKLRSRSGSPNSPVAREILINQYKEPLVFKPSRVPTRLYSEPKFLEDIGAHGSSLAAMMGAMRIGDQIELPQE